MTSAAGLAEKSPSTEREVRLTVWERVSAGPLTGLSLAFLVVYAIPVLSPGLPTDVRHICRVLNLTIWGLFGAEFLLRLMLTPNRFRFVRTHWFDLAVLVLPVLRPLRALRLVMALKVLNQRTAALTRGRLAVYVGATTVLIVAVAALAVLDAERGRAGSSIENYPQALWWAVVTVTTVGYGDYSPVTLEGRFVALAMMVAGIGLIGFVTGSLASWIVERIAAGEKQSEDHRPDTADLATEIRQLRIEIRELRTAVRPGDPGPDAGG